MSRYSQVLIGFYKPNSAFCSGPTLAKVRVAAIILGEGKASLGTETPDLGLISTML